VNPAPTPSLLSPSFPAFSPGVVTFSIIISMNFNVLPRVWNVTPFSASSLYVCFSVYLISSLLFFVCDFLSSFPFLVFSKKRLHTKRSQCISDSNLNVWSTFGNTDYACYEAQHCCVPLIVFRWRTAEGETVMNRYIDCHSLSFSISEILKSNLWFIAV
jgi:hypothetical protein